MTDASNALNPGEDDGAAAAMEYLDNLESKAQEPKPDAPEAPEAEQVEEAPSAEEAPEEAQETEAPADTADPEPEADAEPSVLDDLPDEIRSDLEGLDPEAIEKLKPHLLMQADYTRKTQELAAKRRELEAQAEAAASWEALMADAEILELMSRAKELKEQDTSEPFDYSTAEPEEIDAQIDKRVEEKLAKQEAAEAAEARASDEWKTSVEQAATLSYEASGLDQDQWLTVMDKVSEHFQATGQDPRRVMTAENFETFITPHVASVKLEAVLKSQSESAKRSKADATRSARASSPAPVRTAPVKEPEPWVAEKRPATPEELRAKLMKEFEDQGIQFPS